MKIVINDCFGGFGLSPTAVETYLARKGKQVWWYTDRRDKDGHIDFRAKVPTADPGGEFLSYAYTSPEPSDDTFFSSREVERTDADLIATVGELGDRANGKYASLKIIEIPDGVEYDIDEYDGLESVHEVHRSWS